jgi:DNA polymerase III sliding clamp (beta) subunit (PCNA family)
MDTVIETKGITQHLVSMDTAKSIASFIAFAESARGGYTPALQVIKVVLGDGKITATATDRYAVIQGTYDGYDGKDGVIYLDASVAKFITSYKVPKYTYDPMVAFDVFEGNLTVKTADTSTTIKMLNGNYPAVEILFDSHKPAVTAEVHSFKIELLAKLGKVVGTDGNKIEQWNFEHGERQNPNRPSPLIATNGNFRALIQPMLGLPKA